MISALLLDYEPFWGTEKTKNWFNRLSNLVHKFDWLLKELPPKRKGLMEQRLIFFVRREHVQYELLSIRFTAEHM